MEQRERAGEALNDRDQKNVNTNKSLRVLIRTPVGGERFPGR